MQTTPQPRRAARALGLVGLGACLTLTPSALGRPPAASEKGPAPALARYAPGDDLVLYVEYAGLDAQAAAWRKTAAARLLNETTLGAMLEDLIGQAVRSATANAKDKPPISPDEAGTLARHIAKNGFVVSVNRKPPARPGGVIVLRNASRKGVRPLFDRLLGQAGGADAKAVTRGTRKITTVTPDRADAWSWWWEGDDLVIAPPGGGVDAIVAAIEGKRTSAADHPIRAALAKADDGFRPIGLGFLEIAALPPPPPNVAAAGLAGVQRVELRWGFQQDALMSVLRVVAPAPRKGLLALFDGPGFDLKGVPAVPEGVHGFTVASIDLGKAYDQVVALAKASDPQGGRKVEAGEQALRERLGGLRLREDVLAHLGPKVSFHAKVGEKPAPPGGMMMPGMGMGQTPEFSFQAQVDDPAAFGKTLDTLMAAVNARLKAQAEARPPGAGPGGPGAGPGGPAAEFKKAPGRGTRYTLTPPPGMMPPGMMADLKPTVTLGRSHLIIATTVLAAKDALKAESETWTPGADYRALARQLPRRMVALNVSDPRDSLPDLIANAPMLIQVINMQVQARNGPAGAKGGVPIQVDPAKVPKAEEIRSRLFPGSYALTADADGLRFITREATPSVTSPAGAGVAVGLLLPSVQAAREAARRAQCVNNLKQIALALHNYHDMNNSFPPAALAGKDGRPLLSWRVAILPQLGQQALYDRFKLDEPWDGPNNRRLLQEMPATFACPSVPNPRPGMTTYLAVVGNGAAFEGTKGKGMRDFTDGTSNTLLVVEAKEGVPWTKPDDLTVAPEPAGPLPGVGSPHRGGFNALFADGAVRLLKSTIDPKVLRALTTRNGQEVVDPGSF